MNIILTGSKGSGKSTIGESISELLNINFIETDLYLENFYFKETGKKLSCREIYIKDGENEFREWEKKAVHEISDIEFSLISTGGGTMLNPESKNKLIKNSILILLKADTNFLWERIKNIGLPPFLKGDNGFDLFVEKNNRLYESLEHLADIIFTVDKLNQDDADQQIADLIQNLLMIKMHSPNTFGEIIRATTFGESHGRSVGVVLDGIKPGITLSESDIQSDLDRRRPGQSKVTTQRNESDKIQILSGVFEGKTTGTPICMMVNNKDQDSSKYDNLKNIFRPGHADFTFWKKYGIRDHRGGGRSSGRETIGRVAAGAVAKKILLKKGIEFIAFSDEIAGIKGEVEDYSFIEKNPVRSADPDKAALMEEAILKARKNQDSVGGIVKLLIKNLPSGIGDPVFFKLQARLSMAIFSIGSVKGLEFGLGFKVAKITGSENNDEMKDGKFITNNAGGILGGISTGEDIIAKIAVKPTPSISQNQDTINIDGDNQTVKIEGRHDPSIVPRIIPVIESMAALVILDALMIQEKLKGS